MSGFALPDLGEGLSEAEIVAWHVGVGDHVVADQPLVSVETDKAIVEVPSPRAGRIARRIGEPGDIVAVGATLVEFADTAGEDAGTVVGHIAPCAPAPAERDPGQGEGTGSGADSGARAGAAATASGRPRAAPAVRRRARELGVELVRVRPSGGRVAPSIADVEAAAGEGLDDGTAASGADGWEGLRGPRRAMARRMERTRDEIAAATVSDDADVGDWDAHQRVLPRLVRALAAACAAEPALNAWYDAGRTARRLHARLDLGVAVDTADGLLVPVLRDAGALDEETLAARLGALRAAARARTLAPEDLLGASFTLSNFGPLGGRHAALCVTPPQVAILGAGRLAEAVRVHAGAPAVRRVLPLSLSFDHRAVTGGEAARFLAAAIADLERRAAAPERIR